MKKRFFCALLSLIMLISLVPAGALRASAASMTVSESAITVLKQWNGYRSTCNSDGIIGYGTKCDATKPHGGHTISEKQADTALRTQLKELDKAVNSFASTNGVALSQNQYDALILFSFDNGTAWTTGTGAMKSAVVGRLTGTEFLNAICRWNITTHDDDRRMVEANMYLNNVYSSAVPGNYIRYDYNANGGSLNGAAILQYYDTKTASKHEILPTRTGYIFMGWYANDTVLVPEITSLYHMVPMYAHWQKNDATTGTNNDPVAYTVNKSALASQTVYDAPGGNAVTATLNDTISVDCDFIDSSNRRWVRMAGTSNWLVLGAAGSYGSSVNTGTDIDVTVTITNDYVRSRKENNIFSAQNGTYYMGQKVRIISTAYSKYDNFLWGQIAKSDTDHTPIGWIALMYTDWDTAANNSSTAESNTAVVATAVIKTTANNGYVNVRNGAGTQYDIVGAIGNGSKVSIYETKFVNGHEWGRYNAGWICLTYAEVTRLKEDTTSNSDTGLLSYAFTGTLTSKNVLYTEPNGANIVITDDISLNVTVSHLKRDTQGNTWGKTAYGWVMISNNQGVKQNIDLNVAKYVVTADTVTVRENPSTSSVRKDTLVKGVEFNVNEDSEIVVVGDSVWGYANKVGDTTKTYSGWVNLAGSSVSRVDMPTIKDENGASFTGKMGTVINTDNVNVRAYTAATYKKTGSLARGTTVSVWKEEDGWYKVDSNMNGIEDKDDDGWVSGQYLDVYDVDSTTGTTSNGSKVETGMGIVANTYTGVNVRQGAGTAYAAVGKILAGATVEILEVKTVGNTKWGRVSQGWICMDYVTMVSYYVVSGSNVNGTTTGTGTGTGSNTTSSEKVIFTGTISATTSIYKSSNTSSMDNTRTLYAGDPVTVHELLVAEESNTVPSTIDPNATVTTTTKHYWARINDGYILNPEQHITLDPLNEKTYTVTSYESNVANELKVYDVNGNQNAVTLNKYDQVTVTALEIRSNELWCRVEYTDDDGYNHDGYVKMKYLTQGVVKDPATTNNNTNTNTPPVTSGTVTNGVIIGNTGNTANQGTNGFVNNAGGYRYTGKVIRTNSVNVRALPSQTAALTTTLKNGAAMVIYETTISEGMAWGRCDAGWVYLYYVDLQPCNTAVDAKVVYNENTIAYTDTSCSEAAATYSRMSVVDIYEIVGNMARTEQGWVHMDNLG